MMRSDVDQFHPLIAYPTTQDPQDPAHHVDLLIASVDAKKNTKYHKLPTSKYKYFLLQELLD